MFIFIGFTAGNAAGNGPPAEWDLNQAEQANILPQRERVLQRLRER